MKELYTAPEALLVRFAPAENIASNPGSFEIDLPTGEGDGAED